VKIVIPGGTGQVGTLLARAFHRDGHEVTVLGRSPVRAPWRVEHWDPERLGDWTRWVDGADAVINMAGRSVNCRYTAKNRREIMHSRVGSTRVVGQAIARAKRPPSAWLQASTATIYAHRYDAPNDDETGILGGTEADAPDTWRFSIDVATSWERALDEADVPGTRKIKLRSAVILSPDRGGIFDTILGLVRRGLGGTAGDGKQYVSWIHDADFVRAVYWLLDRREMTGSVNLAAPIRCRTASSWPRCGARGEYPSGSRRAAGCSRSAPSSCGPRPSCFSRAAAWSRADSCGMDSRSSSRTGRMPPGTSAVDGERSAAAGRWAERRCPRRSRVFSKPSWSTAGPCSSSPPLPCSSRAASRSSSRSDESSCRTTSRFSG